MIGRTAGIGAALCLAAACSDATRGAPGPAGVAWLSTTCAGGFRVVVGVDRAAGQDCGAPPTEPGPTWASLEVDAPFAAPGAYDLARSTLTVDGQAIDVASGTLALDPPDPTTGMVLGSYTLTRPDGRTVTAQIASGATPCATACVP